MRNFVVAWLASSVAFTIAFVCFMILWNWLDQNPPTWGMVFRLAWVTVGAALVAQFFLRRPNLFYFDPHRALASLGSYTRIFVALDDRLVRDRHLSRGLGHVRLVSFGLPRGLGVLVFRSGLELRARGPELNHSSIIQMA
jgi:hypothetical protein